MTKKEKAAKEAAKLRKEGAALRKCRAEILSLARAWYAELNPTKWTAAWRAKRGIEPHDYLPALARMIEKERELKAEAAKRRAARKLLRK